MYEYICDEKHESVLRLFRCWRESETLFIGWVQVILVKMALKTFRPSLPYVTGGQKVGNFASILDSSRLWGTLVWKWNMEPHNTWKQSRLTSTMGLLTPQIWYSSGFATLEIHIGGRPPPSPEKNGPNKSINHCNAAVHRPIVLKLVGWCALWVRGAAASWWKLRMTVRMCGVKCLVLGGVVVRSRSRGLQNCCIIGQVVHIVAPSASDSPCKQSNLAPV